MQLAGYFDGRQVISPHQLGMAESEGGTEREGQRKDKGNDGQSVVGNGLVRALGGTRLRTVAASVQKVMFEGPVLGEIIPTVVLLFPAVVAGAAHLESGEGLGVVQGREPNPLVVGGFRLEFSLAVVILGEGLLGADHPDGSGVVVGERQSGGLGVPELEIIGFAVPLLGGGEVGGE